MPFGSGALQPGAPGPREEEAHLGTGCPAYQLAGCPETLQDSYRLLPSFPPILTDFPDFLGRFLAIITGVLECTGTSAGALER